jgi:hypothetical protein
MEARQHHPGGGRRVHHLGGLLAGEGEGLLHHTVLTGPDGGQGVLVVGAGVGGDEDQVDVIPQHTVQALRGAHPEGALRLVAPGRSNIRYGHEAELLRSLRHAAGVVLGLAAETGEPDADRHPSGIAHRPERTAWRRGRATRPSPVG